MSRLVTDLEAILENLVGEQRKLLLQVQAQEQAIRAVDAAAMDAAAGRQEACRLRIAGLDAQRRSIVQQLIRTMRLTCTVDELTVARLAHLYPPRREALLRLREQLRQVGEEISRTTQTSGRVARAVLGHLNTAVRLLAGAVQRAGVYTRQGVPRVAGRIGVMEAVG